MSSPNSAVNPAADHAVHSLRPVVCTRCGFLLVPPLWLAILTVHLALFFDSDDADFSLFRIFFSS